MGGSTPPSADTSPVSVHKQIGITHADFLRTLPTALDGRPFRQDGLRIDVQEAPGRRLEILLSPQEERQLGSMRLPLTRVELVFHGHTESERALLLERFRAAFVRSGG